MKQINPLTADDLTEKGVILTITYSKTCININVQYDDEVLQSLMAAWRLRELIKTWGAAQMLSDYKRGTL